MTDIATTPAGVLREGDVVWWHHWTRRKGRRVQELEWVRVTSRSSLTPTLVFGRNENDKPRCIPISEIRRIEHCE